MGNAAVGWALLLSLIVHVGLLLIPVPDSRTSADQPGKPAAAARSDLWSGQTFEAPELLGPGAPDPAQGRGAGETPAPAPAVRPRPVPKVGSTTAPGGIPGATGSAAAGTGVGTYGAEGSSDGVRDLLRSFVRAMPPAVSADPVWQLLPLGPAASAEVTLAVDDDSKVRILDRPADAPPLPPLIASIVRRTLVLLASGRFALDPRQASVGAEPLRISVAVTQQDPPSDRELLSGGAFGLGSEAPTDSTPGRAYFTLASGRHVDVTVQRVRRAR
jgi:hypothetical protein